MKNTFSILFVVSLLILGNSNTTLAQEWEWVKQYKRTTTAGSITKLLRSEDKNTYLLSNYTGMEDSLIFDTDTIIGKALVNNRMTYILSKFDENGELVFSKDLLNISQDHAITAHVDQSGNIFFAGQLPINDTLNLPNGSSIIHSGTGGFNIFILCYDTALNVKWTLSGSSNSGGVFIEDLFEKDNNIYITGMYGGSLALGDSTLSPIGGNDIYLTKINAQSGNIQWIRRAGDGVSTYDRGYRIRVSDSGNVFIAGTFYGNANFDGQIISSTGIPSVFNIGRFLAKYDKDGNIIWVKGGIANLVSFATDVTQMEIDDEENCYLYTSYGDGDTWGDSTFSSVISSNGHFDNVLLSLDKHGSLRWSRTIRINNYGFVSQMFPNALGISNCNNQIYLNAFHTATMKDSSNIIIGDSIFQRNKGEQFDFQGTFDLSGKFISANYPTYLPRNYANDMHIDQYGDFHYEGKITDTLLINNSLYTPKNGNRYIGKLKPFSDDFLELAVADTFFCHNELPITLNIGNTSLSEYDYEWTPKESLNNPSVGNPQATVSKTTIYHVKASKPCYTSIKDSVTISILPKPILEIGNDTIINKNTTITLQATGNGILNWNHLDGSSICNNCSEIEVNPIDPAYYIAILTDSVGCYTQDTIFVAIKSEINNGDVFIPNVFSPNGNSYNNTFSPIVSIGIIESMSIFDRQGQLIYHSTASNGHEWNGANYNEDVYTYQVNIRDENDTLKQFVGNVSLLR